MSVATGQPDYLTVYQFSEGRVVTKMDMNPSWHELVKRVENFRWNMTADKITNGNEDFYIALCDLKNEYTVDWWSIRKTATSELLVEIFLGVYDFVVKQSLCFGTFQEESPIYDDVYEACLFTTLCVFLHTSMRIKGKSLKDFIRDTSPMEYNNPDSSNYRSPSLLTSDEEKLRRTRNRLFSTREMLRQVKNAQLSGTSAYYKRSQWSAMTKDAEHEWTFYHTLNGDNSNAASVLSADAKDTFKRMGNLYKDILPALLSPKDDGYTDRVDAAYKKFSSKLSKIKYASYLELLQEIFRHLKSNKAYYGINLYRLEKELHPFAITRHVNRMLACQNEAMEITLLNKAVILNNIWFPRLRENFASLRTCDEMAICVRTFSEFLNMVVGSACLVIDELVEKGCLGDDWESLFIQMTNEMAESIFYAPSEIDFTVSDGSQEKFRELLDEPIRRLVSQEKKPKQGTQ